MPTFSKSKHAKHLRQLKTMERDLRDHFIPEDHAHPAEATAPVIAPQSEPAIEFEDEEPFFNIFTDTPASIEARAA